jgi:hypothetical protein
MPTTLDDPIRPLDPPPLADDGDDIADPAPLGTTADKFPRRPRRSVADAVRQALRPRGTRGKTPFELGSRSR